MRSDSRSTDAPYPSSETAESAFWGAITDSIMAARTPKDPYACWPGVELAAVRDPLTKKVHLVERVSRMCRVRVLLPIESAQTAFWVRLLQLIPEEVR
jgi:hypothetical protein